MSVLSRNTILQSVESGTLGIEPFYQDGLEPASYDLRLHWELLVSPSRHERGRPIDLRDEPGNRYAVQPGRFVGILTDEILTIPLSIAGRFGLRSEFTRQGLVWFGGIQLDPGFRGRIAISLFNAGPEPIALEWRRKTFTVEFNFLDQPVEESQRYAGDFQDQEEFPSVQRDFILNAHTVSLSEINALPEEIAHVRQQLMVHENSAHGVSRAATLLELAVAQGIKPLENPDRLFGRWPEGEDFDAFLESVRPSREPA